MSNFVLYLIMFGLGALWMRSKCLKLYESELWRAERDLRIEKLKLQREKVRSKISQLLDDQIGER